MIETLREIREEFQQPIHRGTILSLWIVGVGSFLGGSQMVASGSLAGSAAGGLLAILAMGVALYQMPGAATVAIEWREQQRLDEDGGRDE